MRNYDETEETATAAIKAIDAESGAPSLDDLFNKQTQPVEAEA